MWKVFKDIICRRLTHINRLPNVFIDNNREYQEDEITEGFNTFFTIIGSTFAKRITLRILSLLIHYQAQIVIISC